MSLLLWVVLLQDAETLIRALRSDDPQIRAGAEAMLIERGAEVLPVLEAHRRARDPDFRSRVWQLMERLDSSYTLVRALGSDKVAGNAERARRMLASRLAADPKRVVPLLQALIASTDIQAQFYAAFLLYRGGRGGDVADGFFGRAVDAYWAGEMEQMRWLAARVCALASRGRPDDEVDEVFEQSLRSVSTYAIVQDMIALWKEAPKPWRIPDPLMARLVENITDGRQNWDVTCAKILRTDARRVVPHLVGRLSARTDDARVTAARYLIHTFKADPRPDVLVEVIAEHVRDESEFIRVLREERERAIPALKRLMMDPQGRVRFDVARMLFELDPQQATPDMIREMIRQFPGSAMATLALIRSGPAADPLLPRLLSSEDTRTMSCGLVILRRRGALPEQIPARVTERLERSLYRSNRPFSSSMVEAFECLGPAASPILRRAERSGYRVAERRASTVQGHAEPCWPRPLTDP